MKYSEEEKVTYASFMPQGDGNDRWEREKGKLGHDDPPFSWEGFKRVFYKKYFFESIHHQKF